MQKGSKGIKRIQRLDREPSGGWLAVVSTALNIIWINLGWTCELQRMPQDLVNNFILLRLESDLVDKVWNHDDLLGSGVLQEVRANKSYLRLQHFTSTDAQCNEQIGRSPLTVMSFSCSACSASELTAPGLWVSKNIVGSQHRALALSQCHNTPHWAIAPTSA